MITTGTGRGKRPWRKRQILVYAERCILKTGSSSSISIQQACRSTEGKAVTGHLSYMLTNAPKKKGARGRDFPCLLPYHSFPPPCWPLRLRASCPATIDNKARVASVSNCGRLLTCMACRQRQLRRFRRSSYLTPYLKMNCPALRKAHCYVIE